MTRCDANTYIGILTGSADLPAGVGQQTAEGVEQSETTGAVPYPARSEDLKGTKDLAGYGTKEEASEGAGPFQGVTSTSTDPQPDGCLSVVAGRDRDSGRFVARDETQRFWEKVDKQPDGCWLWTAGVDKDGYGLFKAKRDGTWRTIKAHRWAYETLVGPTDGLPVDHVRARGCQHRHCVRPDHLEAVSTLENTRRSRQPHPTSPVTPPSPPPRRQRDRQETPR